ncbi:MAG: metal ABC transporter solute-binding protein, Zn/Mn family, partial [Puniceicoccales bacterium]
MKRSLLAYLALLLGLATVQAKVNVVASNAIIADWAQAVGGNEVTVSTLAGPGTDPHHFSPSPKLVRSLAKTDLIIEFGAG